MTALQALFLQPWVERLGWALIHFLWQGSLIAALYLVAHRAMPQTNPNSRYLVACAALCAMMAAPIVTWNVISPADHNADATYRTYNPQTATSTSSVAPAPAPLAVHSISSSLQPERILPWVVMAWLAGGAVFWVRLAGGWLIATRMQSAMARPAPTEWQEFLRGLGARLAICRPVRLLVSSLVQVPTVFGWLRPVILMPVGALGGLPVEHLEALLLHELAHIRRHDYLVNMLQSVAEALLFYHPAVWWVSGQVRAERELCCDDAAVSASGDVLTYARALLQLESYRPQLSTPAVAANGGSLSQRIARVLGQPRPATRFQFSPGLFAVAIPLLSAWMSIAPGWSQPQTAPAAASGFEVATIKQLDRSLQPGGQPDVSFVGTSGKPFKIAGNRVTITATLHSLIAAAYGVRIYQVSAAPSWADTLIYQVVATSPGDPAPTQDEVRPMLQSLLAERFQLEVRHEAKEMPVYHLIIAKKTNRFRLSTPDETFNWTLSPGSSPGMARSKATKESMLDFVQLVGVSADRPVIDKTGITGDIDYEIEYAIPGGGPIAEGEGRVKGPSWDDLNRAIIEAVKDQLGLKLEPAKDSIDTLIAERVQKPSEN